MRAISELCFISHRSQALVPEFPRCANQCVPRKELCQQTSGVAKKQVNYKALVGQRIKALRLQAGLSQEALSEHCGIFRTYLSRIESGSANPTLLVLVALAASLKVPPHELFMHD